LTASIKSFSQLAQEMNKVKQEGTAQKQIPTRHRAVMTNTISTGSGFARSLLDGTDIFILATHVAACNLKPGDPIIAQAVPNKLREKWTPDSPYAQPTVWFSVWTERDLTEAIEEQATPAKQEVKETPKPKKLRDLAYEALGDDIMSASDVAKVMGCPTANAFAALDGLYDVGLIARINVEHKDLARTGRVYWCRDRSALGKAIKK
jgi:hypothetical protein